MKRGGESKATAGAVQIEVVDVLPSQCTNEQESKQEVSYIDQQRTTLFQCALKPS